MGGCRNGKQQLVVRHLVLITCYFSSYGDQSPTCNHERYIPILLLSLQRKGQLAGCSLGYTPYFSVSKLSFVHRLHEAETGSRPTNGSYATSSNSNHCFFQNRAGSEWHPSDQAMQCSVFTLQCYMLSSGSWQVFHGVGLGMFSHKLADYCIMIAHLTSNSFEGNSC